MKVGVITPTRGDRPEFLNQCKKYVAEQTYNKVEHFIIDYKPLGPGCDIVPRIKEGIRRAKNAGVEYIFIFEDDDFYPHYYIEYILNALKLIAIKDLKTKIVGSSQTVYYHLTTDKTMMIEHLERSSLFLTSFGINALDKFNWPADNYPNLDFTIWNYANQNKIGLISSLFALGIKHGIGKTGGLAHDANFTPYQSTDPDYLKNTTRKHYPFYKSIQEKLKCIQK